ncbi:hypothetical protein [Aurantiacibacter zhengii]|uniref:DUF4398 domain-containing protein n=1 Tax=Aurantiacibacter zhengii TaxID=2307003 RepID=A0A418NXH5_9SPHN|nr:hypothetical protein [Aurantiacibacter zhengii]RIV89309.1 hypothetical protein D2V07_03480 [Aurantiacibacter zhengii]
MVQVSRLFPVAAFVLLAACAAPEGEYPSLAIRDVERVSGSMEVEPAPPLPAPPASTLASLDELAAAARAAHQRFGAAESQARRITSSAVGAARGSEAWARAQVAIADLEAQRSQAMIALADLDRIYVEAATSAQATESIAEVRNQVDALVAQEDAVIRSLLDMLTG